eukprot:435493-Prorocentrum_minimum.AAC.2
MFNRNYLEDCINLRAAKLNSLEVLLLATPPFYDHPSKRACDPPLYCPPPGGGARGHYQGGCAGNVLYPRLDEGGRYYDGTIPLVRQGCSSPCARPREEQRQISVRAINDASPSGRLKYRRAQSLDSFSLEHIFRIRRKLVALTSNTVIVRIHWSFAHQIARTSLQ